MRCWAIPVSTGSSSAGTSSIETRGPLRPRRRFPDRSAPGFRILQEDHPIMANPNEFGIAGLLGWPVAHSRSPVIHNHWLARYGIPGRYVLFPVPPEKLEAALRGLQVLGLRGCNVTTPHKQAIFPLLDRVDDLARLIGAVNTVVVEKDGTLTGFNNDG